ncbi:I78 family peptidase inhibitor [Novosphingobium malaysiense]|uniref:Peptidase inhibitor I78 n=1 Tax=Novosphingobium malaysiense TaxID=1348853 RepID=A0A0B1ZPN5_9SPHN|nr:I78 family peptidase inhibitor [Novosphingobium malaysiense]KHK91233.1 hypothetical protein LK12_10085 [Novosphingobium malaysiense]
MTRRLPLLPAAAGAALMALAGCSTDGTENPATMPPPPDMQPTCGADMLDAYIGRPASDSTIAAIREWRGDNLVRVIRPGTVVTMDYRPERLNIDVDENGTITGFRCT